MFRPMFRNKVTFEKWPPNTKYALGGLGSYRNKVTFYIKGNLKGNLISEHARERACEFVYASNFSTHQIYNQLSN